MDQPRTTSSVSRGDGSSTGSGAGSPIAAAWRDHRGFATDLAFRMLGDIGEAEDVVQEGYARLLKSNEDEISDVRGWLVVVVSRLCLDILRSSRMRRGVSVPGEVLDSTVETGNPLVDPADRITLDDSVRSALLVVLEKLSPSERTAFVLHDVFGYDFDTVGSIVGRSSQACRQLAVRARQRVQSDAGPTRFEVAPADHRELAEQFISACAGGDLEKLMKLLDPKVVGGIDADERGRAATRSGRSAVGRNLMRYIGGGTGMTLVTSPLTGPVRLLGFLDGELMGAFDLEIEGGLVTHIDAFRLPERLDALGKELGLRRTR